MLKPICAAMAVVLSAMCARAADTAAVFDIPKIDSVVIDGKADDWGQAGFHVDALMCSQPHAIPSAVFDATVRLGWDEKGLLVLLTVHDDHAIETEAIGEMYKNDCVELFIRPDPVITTGALQVIIGPGMGNGHDTVRTYFHDYREGDNRKIPPKIEVARTPIPGGYVMEVRYPVESISLTCKEGAIIPFAVVIDDTKGNGSNTRMGWEAIGGAFHNLRLGAKTSPPIRDGALGGYELLRRSVVFVNATADLAGKEAVVVQNEKVLARGMIPPSEDGERLTHLRLIYPMPPDGSSPDGVILKVDGEADAKVKFIDPKGFREEAVRGLEVRPFSSAIFSGDVLPMVGLTDPSLAEDTMGPITTRVRYFDSDFHPVRYAGKPGRYGAVFEAHGEDGEIKLQRFITLFRKGDSAETDPPRGQALAKLLADDAGISAAQIAQQQSILSDSISAFESGNASEGLAQTFAAIGESGGELARPAAQNDRWWYGLKKSLGMTEPLPTVTFFPKGYDPKGNKKWPLIVFLHGSGGMFTKDLLHDGVKRIADAQSDTFNFVVLQPASPDFRWWNTAELDDTLDTFIKNNDVDPNRIYLTGFSMGGYGTWEWAIDRPDRFAAIAPVAGIGNDLYVSRVAKIPVWFFNSETDEAVPYNRAKKMVDAVEKNGGEVKRTVYHGVNHTFSSRLAYETPELYAWFLQHSLHDAKAPQ